MFKLTLISREEIFQGESEVINQLLSLGNFNFHLRKKNAEEKEIRKLILKINQEFYPRIVVHQHFKMEKEFSFHGIHLPENRRTDYEVLKSEGHKIISTSIHFLKEYESLRKNFKYIFFGPVFPSISKPGYEPVYSREVFLNDLAEIKNKSGLIGLGGIDEKNVPDVKAWGFAGAAVLGSVWENKSPVKYFQALLKTASGESR